MRFVKNTTWEEVFDGWRQREANNPNWIHCATKIKGWPDWESWRKFTASQIGLENLSWRIFEFTDPINEIPAMLIGPYASWQARVLKKNQSAFEDILNIPEQFDFFKKHDKVISMINDFPSPTELIGLIREDKNKIVCLEGHHRAIAVALAKKQNKSIDFKENINIALAKLKKDQVGILDDALKRSTSKKLKKLRR